MISVIIPALNEEEPIAEVVRGCLTTGLPAEVIVVDNGSSDRTAARAQAADAKVVSEPTPGYGRACAAGIRALSPPQSRDDVVVFLDGDGSDCPEFLPQLIEPILRDEQDFVIGSRTRGKREAGSMNFQQVFAGRVAGCLLRLLYDVRYSDMCPFRAIRRSALDRLGMKELTYGWNLEMQMRAAKANLRILELPVDHRNRRGGRSKVSGNLSGSLKAVGRIVWTFQRLARDLR
jgi:glycosyltransferase involved in cell wall biosynthesis